MRRRGLGSGCVTIIFALFFVVGHALTADNNLLTVNREMVRTDEEVSISIQSQGDDITRLDYQIGKLSWEEVLIDGKTGWSVVLGNEAAVCEKGMPALPKICRSLIIPDNAEMSVRVTYSDYEVYDNVLIAPSKGTLLRSVNPADIPYEFGDVYYQDAWYPERIVELNDPYIIRDYRGQVVEVYPYQYNPVTRQLRAYSDITVEVFPDGNGKINVLNRTKPMTTIDSEFKHIYKKHFLNFGPEIMGYTAVEDQGNMLVITYDNFRPAMEVFVAWKNMKGIRTDIVNVSEIGNDEDLIKDYIRNYYNTNGLTFVLLVGDYQQITTFVERFGYENGATDPTYSYLVGDDHYPDLFVGRFSAQDIGQTSTMVRRSVEYERYPHEGAAWYTQGAGIASNQGPGDDGEMDWEHIRNIRSDLMNYTYTRVDELYDGSHGGEDEDGNPTPYMVTSTINAGTSVINYCGHGWDQGWSTSGFDNYDVNGLTNDNILPFIWSVACNNGGFDDNLTCFAEAWLRAVNGGEPTGAVGAFMSSISQSWDPPMEGQDEMNAILCEMDENNIKRSYGGISFNGCMSMNDKYGNAGYEMTDTWHIFGDPSLEVRTDTPGTITVDHDATISIGSNGFEVTVTGLEGALCALSRDSTYLGAGYTNGSGRAIVHLDEPLTAGEDLVLMVTAYNKIPYEANISVTSDPALLYVDDSYPQFAIMSGGWRSGSHENAWNAGGWFTRGSTGSGSVGWGVNSFVESGTYDVYVWKFEHNFMGMMATDAHYKVHHSTGESDWIIVDQSTPGDEWIYLGTFDFDRYSTQGVQMTDEANGVVIADAIRLEQVSP